MISGHALTVHITWLDVIGLLKALQEEHRKSGNLEATLAVRKEIKRFELKPLAKDEQAALHPSISALRAQFDTALQQAASKAEQDVLQEFQTYAAVLLDLQNSFAKTGDAAGAAEAGELHTAAAKRVRELGGAVPIPNPGPPPPPPPLPAKPADSGAPVPVMVAESIVAKGSISGTASNVIGFDGPRGDGRSGAKGILVQMDPDLRDTGSTWMLDYSREHRNTRSLQIIHPRSKGHAVVHINRSGIGTSIPETWSKIGYRSLGSGAKMTKAAENFFPLEDGRVYAIVSRMESNGGLEVYIDGVLVATERVRSAKRLSLGDPADPPFKGEGLPMQWESNSAGIIVGPRDAGSHSCKNLRYCPGVILVP